MKESCKILWILQDSCQVLQDRFAWVSMGTVLVRNYHMDTVLKLVRISPVLSIFMDSKGHRIHGAMFL